MKLDDIRIIMKKKMAYNGAVVGVTLVYLALLLGLSHLLLRLPLYLGIPATVVMVVLFAFLFHWVKTAIDRAAAILLDKQQAVPRQIPREGAGKKGYFISADIDELTGLRNHRYFQESLNEAIEKSAISGDDFALLFIDLDLFKTYNDIYSHVMGDELLSDFGRLIRRTIRETDVGARYGGDEFACILRQTDVNGARKVAERIRRKIEAHTEQKGAVVTCSIGISCWRIDGVIREKIVAAANQALYQAKRAGGNRVCLASKLDVTEEVETGVVAKTSGNEAVESIVYALAATVDTRDHYTYGHSQTVCRYAVELAQAAGYSPEEVQTIRSAALLHDIGKLNLPDSILTKRDPLTDAEWDMIRHHPELGAHILSYIVGLRDCLDAVLYHHERYDGNGYPRGLAGENIPRDARILAIADSYEAMTSERSYKKRPLTQEEAIQELESCSGTQFDPELVEIFIKLRKEAVTPTVDLDTILQNGETEVKKTIKKK